MTPPGDAAVEVRSVSKTYDTGVEALRDVSFRVVPLSERDAEEMIREIRAYPVLEGFRGRGPRDLGAIRDLLLRVSALAREMPGIEELDLNPVFVHDRGVQVADARIVMAPAPA